MSSDGDKVLEALEKLKKRALAAFVFVSLLIAMVLILLVELHAIKKVWDALSSASAVHAYPVAESIPNPVE